MQSGETWFGSPAIKLPVRQKFKAEGEHWTFEPHVAEALFRQYLQQGSVEVLYEYRIVGLEKEKQRIRTIKVEHSLKPNSLTNKTIQALMFIDCSYEGDLMARAGVSYTVGRESNKQYDETYNGVQLLGKHQFPDGVDPYRVPGHPESGLLWGIRKDSLGLPGTGDKKIQAYNFRLCLTNIPEKRIPISRPEDYDSTRYELLLRQIAIGRPDSLNWQLFHIAPVPGGKTDINNCGGFSSDMIGMNYDYPEADYAKRKEIIRAHEQYTKGWLYFLGHDPRMPPHLRQEMLTWGYPSDEYNGEDHFTHQLYIREARRMVGSFVMTQHHCEGREVVTDGVAMAAYTMDSHNCQRLVVRGMVKNEGDVQVGGFGPYPISYRAIVPQQKECANLLVPVCLSASHIAYGSIRMEPVFMVLAQSAAVAACLALDKQTSVQAVEVKELQAILKSDPIADHSAPEMVMDDQDSLNVEFGGKWKKNTELSGRYGPTVRISNEKGAFARFVVPPQAQPGIYSVYLYCPSLKGVSNNLLITLQLNQRNQKSVDVRQYRDEWVLLGQYEIGNNKRQFLNIESGKESVGFAFADAVLFIPVPRP